MARLQAAQRRDEILTAATAVFARSSYRAARVRDIAREAGVSEPLIYRHFPSKLALFCEILETVGLRIVEIWEKEIADAPDGLEALRRAGQIYVKNLAAHPAEASLQFQALAEAAEPEISAVLRSNHNRYVAFFEALIERGKREGVIRGDVDPGTTAWLLDGTGFSFTLRSLLDPDQGDPAANEAVMEILLGWLAAPQSRGRTR